jgi:hypothetical protein
MPVRALTEAEQASERGRRQQESVPEVLEQEQRRPSLRASLATSGPLRLGEPFSVVVRMTNLESRNPPVHKGRSLIDSGLLAEVVDPRGAVHGLPVEHSALGEYQLEFIPDQPGIHVLSLAADGQGFSFTFQALPAGA